MANSDLKDEYLDVSANIRHWNTLRFAELTIFIALTGALLNVITGKSPPPPPLVGAVAKTVGMLLAMLFLVLQERTMLYWYSFIERAAELEKDLGFQQYTLRPRAGIMTGRNAMRLFFVLIILFWAISLFWFPA